MGNYLPVCGGDPKVQLNMVNWFSSDTSNIDTYGIHNQENNFYFTNKIFSHNRLLYTDIIRNGLCCSLFWFANIMFVNVIAVLGLTHWGRVTHICVS